MMQGDPGWFRLAVLSSLVNRSEHKLGRTALMKFAYLLQTFRRVPLGYRFKLYTYGPFDSDVLSDLSQAVSLNAVESQIVHHAGGYGYEYSSASDCEFVLEKARDQLDRYSEDIDWVLETFGSLNASQLELYSTIVFAERELKRKKQHFDKSELAKRVHSIKPHFTESLIEETIDSLAEQNLFAA